MLIPWRPNADANDDPIMSEGEKLHERLAAAVVRQQGIVMHAPAPDMRAALAAECVIDGEDDRRVLWEHPEVEGELKNSLA